MRMVKRLDLAADLKHDADYEKGIQGLEALAMETSSPSLKINIENW